VTPLFRSETPASPIPRSGSIARGWFPSICRLGRSNGSNAIGGIRTVVSGSDRVRHTRDLHSHTRPHMSDVGIGLRTGLSKPSVTRHPVSAFGQDRAAAENRQRATVLAPQDLDAQHRGKLFPVNESDAAPQSLPAGVSDFSNSGKTRGGKDRSLFGQDWAAAENRQRATMQTPQGLDAQHRGEQISRA